MGGEGQVVSGKLAVPKDQRADFNFALVRLATQRPANSPQAQIGNALLKALGDWLSIGQKYAAAQNDTTISASFAAKVGPDGAFQFDGVLAGHYTLTAQVNEPPRPSNVGWVIQLPAIRKISA